MWFSGLLRCLTPDPEGNYHQACSRAPYRCGCWYQPSTLAGQGQVEGFPLDLELPGADPVVEPFGDGWPEDPDEIAFLLSLREARIVVTPGVPVKFRKTDVKWALKLRRSFGWPNSWNLRRAYSCHQVTKAFADREFNARSFGREPDFSDLGDWLSMRPWESDERA